MKRDGSALISMLALALSLVAVLFSAVACIYVATYLENGIKLVKSLDRLSDALNKK